MQPIVEVRFTKKGKAQWREAREDGTFSRWTRVDTETAKKALKEQKIDGERRRVVERE